MARIPNIHQLDPGGTIYGGQKQPLAPIANFLQGYMQSKIAADKAAAGKADELEKTLAPYNFKKEAGVYDAETALKRAQADYYNRGGLPPTNFFEDEDPNGGGGPETTSKFQRWFRENILGNATGGGVGGQQQPGAGAENYTTMDIQKLNRLFQAGDPLAIAEARRRGLTN